MVLKKEEIMGNCAACGMKNTLDNKHKLSDFIRKHPPTDNLTEF